MVDRSFGEQVQGQKYLDREGAYLICIQDKMAAVVKTPRGYFLLGGGLYKGESHIECIKREILEEIGFSCEVGKYVCSADTYGLHERLGYFHPIQYYYSGKLGMQTRMPVEKDHSLEWISINDIENKMYVKSQGWAVKYLSDRYNK